MEWTGDFINRQSFPDLDIEIGRNTYGRPRILANPGDKRKLRIGSFCSIAENVKIFVGGFGRHPTHLPTTYPLAYLFNVSRKNFDRSHLSRPLDTIIGNDVWIGRDATIFAGVTIGDGAVIGANALVNKDVQPYSVVGGIPARQINYRFSESQIRKLLDLRWWEFPDAVILQEINMFYQSNIDAFIAHMSRYKSNT
ncbi:CatB-related O-acetyltransferase [Shewanella vesiculosa]|uniref:CatB-related O-acetyltransferase n=1 Tax=Shewanella vesiculosa TaxID=518738 RepID=UPI002358677E|nr:CatB-related O-acetyltransferase [Shewanella vesiculosa]NCP76485.1 CatB-related O-acetyltransferase [Shewanella vesiculosa]